MSGGGAEIEELARWLCSVERVDDGPMEAVLSEYLLGFVGKVDVSGDLLEASKKLFAMMEDIRRQTGMAGFEVRLGDECTDLFAYGAGPIHHYGPMPKKPKIKVS